MVEQYFVHNENLAATVQILIIKLRETGSISDRKQSGRPSTNCTIQTFKAVQKSIAETPGASVRHSD